MEILQTGARRRWTMEKKLRIVAESYSERRMV
jgi:transposase-like protein